MKRLLFFLFLFSSSLLQAHDGHADVEGILQIIGKFHLLFLHFPIALVIMTLFAEILFHTTRNTYYDQAATFMIAAAAVFVVITALLGWAYSYGMHYEGYRASYFWWHRLLGIITALVTCAAASLKEVYPDRRWRDSKAYYTFLIAAFIGVFLTGYFGGVLSFGPLFSP